MSSMLPWIQKCTMVSHQFIATLHKHARSDPACQVLVFFGTQDGHREQVMVTQIMIVTWFDSVYMNIPQSLPGMFRCSMLVSQTSSRSFRGAFGFLIFLLLDCESTRTMGFMVTSILCRQRITPARSPTAKRNAELHFSPSCEIRWFCSWHIRVSQRTALRCFVFVVTTLALLQIFRLKVQRQTSPSLLALLCLSTCRMFLNRFSLRDPCCGDGKTLS